MERKSLKREQKSSHELTKVFLPKSYFNRIMELANSNRILIKCQELVSMTFYNYSSAWSDLSNPESGSKERAKEKANIKTYESILFVG